ncbi:hypothetical protein Tco_1195106 [Tanacetum coccineum]
MELKDTIMVAIPKLVEEVFYTCTIRVEYEWKPHSSTSTTPIVEKNDRIERLNINGKVTLVDDEGKPLEKVDSLGDQDSADGIELVDNEMASFLASEKVGYGTNSLLEQWKETYKNADHNYDPYDDDMHESQEIPDKIQSICDNLDIKVRGRKKK